jgi:hypothetical protein
MAKKQTMKATPEQMLRQLLKVTHKRELELCEAALRDAAKRVIDAGPGTQQFERLIVDLISAMQERTGAAMVFTAGELEKEARKRDISGIALQK